MAKTKNDEKATEETTTALVRPNNTALAEFDYGEDERAGYEFQTKADKQIPIVKLLQQMSPEVAEEIARPGDWFNTATNEVYKRDTGFGIVPATTRRLFAKWTPREQGGGFHGHELPESDVVKKAMDSSTKFGKYHTPDGLILKETFYVYGITLALEGWPIGMIVIPFTSTKIRPYRGWMTRLSQANIQLPSGRKVNPPLFANRSLIKSKQDKNDQGTFYVPVIESFDPRGIPASLMAPTDEAYQLAKTLRQLVDADEAKVDFSKQENEPDDAGGTMRDGKMYDAEGKEIF